SQGAKGHLYDQGEMTHDTQPIADSCSRASQRLVLRPDGHRDFAE
ncbi:hypothetical protein LCGC14_2339110, partial [marine sediment metagenome]